MVNQRHELSGSEQQPDANRPAEVSEQPSATPKLVFKPDVKQATLVSRVRTFTLMAAAILMVVALYLIISFRPPPVVLSGVAASEDTTRSIDSASPARPRAAVQPAAAPRTTGRVVLAKSAAAAIDTLSAAAGEKWLRATELSPQGVATGDNTDDAAAKLRKAVTIADSARRDVALARQQAEVVLKASREAGSRTAFRLSVLYAALDRYLKSLEGDADDRYFYYAKSEASFKAMVLGDEAESETQQNVANGYLRSSEERQTGIRRLARQVREALGNLDNVGR
jgi:hypothetical protein